MELFKTYVQNKSDATYRIFSYFCGTKNRRDGEQGCVEGGGRTTFYFIQLLFCYAKKCVFKT